MNEVAESHKNDPGRFAAVNGYVYVALFMGGFIGGSVGAKTGGSYPTPWSSAGQIHAFYAASHTASIISSITQALAAIALLAFSAVLAAQLSRNSFSRVPPRLVQAGGASAAVFLLFSAVCEWLLSRPEILSSIDATRLVQDLSFATGGVAHVLSLSLLVGAPSIIAIGTRWLPRWLGVFGMVIVLAALLGVFSFASQTMTAFLPVARFASMVWILIVATLLMKSRPRT